MKAKAKKDDIFSVRKCVLKRKEGWRRGEMDTTITKIEFDKIYRLCTYFGTLDVPISPHIFDSINIQT